MPIIPVINAAEINKRVGDHPDEAAKPLDFLKVIINKTAKNPKNGPTSSAAGSNSISLPQCPQA